MQENYKYSILVKLKKTTKKTKNWGKSGPISAFIHTTNYQSLVWKQALNTNFELHFPIGNGWQDNEETLEIVWMERKPSPESMLELITCNCQRALCGDHC